MARSGTLTLSLVGLRLPELPTLIPHGFVPQHDAACGHQFFDVTIAPAAAEEHPDTTSLASGYWSVTSTRTNPWPASKAVIALPRIVPWAFVESVALMAWPGRLDVVSRSPG